MPSNSSMKAPQKHANLERSRLDQSSHRNRKGIKMDRSGGVSETYCKFAGGALVRSV
jgi:hypothetical protein